MRDTERRYLGGLHFNGKLDAISATPFTEQQGKVVLNLTTPKTAVIRAYSRSTTNNKCCTDTPIVLKRLDT